MSDDAAEPVFDPATLRADVSETMRLLAWMRQHRFTSQSLSVGQVHLQAVIDHAPRGSGQAPAPTAPRGVQPTTAAEEEFYTREELEVMHGSGTEGEDH